MSKLNYGLFAFAATALLSIGPISLSHSSRCWGQEESQKDASSSKQPEAKQAAKSKTPWRSLKEHWAISQFGGEGEVAIKDGVIKMEYGDPLTGVRWAGPFEGDEKVDPKMKDVKPLPRDNYELQWECIRDKGFDFMCAVTFPVEKQHASLVMGGWGGGITGISSIDGRDASDNNTTMFNSYDNEKWYHARVRVEKAKITVWIDGKEMFDHPRKGFDFDIRFEMDPCTPLGIANFECDSRIRKFQIRTLHPSELAKVEEEQ